MTAKASWHALIREAMSRLTLFKAHSETLLQRVLVDRAVLHCDDEVLRGMYACRRERREGCTQISRVVTSSLDVGSPLNSQVRARP